jgi:hypothetical protein
MPDLMPAAMENVMPKMLPLCVPRFVPKMEACLKGQPNNGHWKERKVHNARLRACVAGRNADSPHSGDGHQSFAIVYARTLTEPTCGCPHESRVDESEAFCQAGGRAIGIRSLAGP